MVTILVFGAAPLSGFVGLELPEFSFLNIKAKAATNGTCGENITWSFDESTGWLKINGTGEMDDYAQPEDIPWYSVKSDIKYVEISNGVTSIGDFAFSNCTKITRINIPNTVIRIGSNALAYTYSLKNISLPDSLKYIDSFAFIGCGKVLGERFIPDSVISIGDGAFYNSKFGSLIIGKGVTTIGDRAFGWCTGLTKVTMGDNVLEIGDGAFEDCEELMVVTLNNKIEKISDYTFYNCTSLMNIDIPENVKSIGNYAFYKCTTLSSVVIPDKVEQIGNYCFSECRSLTAVTVGNSVKNIGDYAFNSCNAIEKLNFLSTSVERIGDYAFYYCDLLKVTIPEGVNEIGDFAFFRCSSASIPKSVTQIGVGAFTNVNVSVNVFNDYYYSDDSKCLFNRDKTELLCFSIRYATGGYSVPSTVTKICDYAFYESPITMVAIPDSVNYIGDYAFYNCSELAVADLPDSADYIGKEAFRGCSVLKSIEIPNGIEKIENHSFDDCEYLESIKLPETLKSIEDYSFDGCWSLTDLIIPNGVEYIGDFAFDGCSSLIDLIIPDSVISIGHAAFSCRNLKTITLGEGIVDIGSNAFLGCYSLTDVYYTGDLSKWCCINFEDECSNPMYNEVNFYINGVLIEDELVISGDVTSIKNYVFCNYDNISSVTISENITSIGAKAFYGCDKLTEVKIPNTVTSIGKYTFGCCENLSSLIIPDSVKEIGDYAFYCCKSLSSVIIPDSVKEIGDYAFAECNSIKTVTIGNGVTDIGEYAFSKCYNINDVTIGDKVANIGNGAFYDNYRIVNVYFNGTLSEWCSIRNGDDFSNLEYADNLYINGSLLSGDIVIPDDVNYITCWAFHNCEEITSVTIPDSVTCIDSGAFSGCTGLVNVYYTGDLESWCKIDFVGVTSNPLRYADNLYINDCLIEGTLTIPDSINQIQKNSFYNYDNISKIVIPNSIESIGDSAFYSCSNLMELEIPDSVTSIGAAAFGGCGCLESVEIPKSITNINDRTFANCSNLKSVKIPLSVTSIGDAVFNECDNLTAINYIGTEEQWYSVTKGEKNDNILNIIVFECDTDRAYYASGTCGENLNWIITPEKEFIISGTGDMTDYTERSYIPWNNKVSLIKTLIIGNGVTSIGDYAFYLCTEMESIYYDGNEEEWNNVSIGKNNYIFNYTPITFSEYKLSWLIDNEEFSDYVKAGDKILIPDFENKTGYTFSGWSSNVPDVMPSNALTFTAIWTINSYDVVFDANGGLWADGETTKVKTFDYNSEIVAPEIPTKMGYIFSGWEYKNNNLGTNLGMMDDDNSKYYTAVWIASTDTRYVVETYIMNTEGEYVKTVQTLTGETDSTVNAQYNVTDGFTLNQDKSILDGIVTGDNSLVLKVYLDRNIYTLTTVVDEVRESTDFYYDSYISENIPEKEGYSFVGWDKQMPQKMPAKDLTFTAKWKIRNDIEYTVKTYTMGIDGNYVLETVTKQGTAFSNVTIGDTQKTGFTLNNSKSVLSGIVVPDGSLVLVVYFDRNIYTFTTVVEGKSTEVKYYYGENITNPVNPVKVGYKFTGWDKTIPSTMPANDVTVTAKFDYYVNISILKPSTTSINYGDKIILHASINEELPVGWEIKWTVDNNRFDYSVSTDGSSCTISPSSSGNTTFTATVYDEFGNVASSDSQTMTSKAGFFDKIIAFFKGLFGMTKTIPQVFKGII